MAFNIDSFKSQGLVLGGARPSLFQVTVNFPVSVETRTNVPQGGRFLIQSAQLPASLIDEVRVPYFGRFIKVAGDRTFQDWSVTVMNDENFALRNAFEEWHNSINTIVSNRLDGRVASINGLDSYKTDLFVSQYSKEGPPNEAGVIRKYRFVGAFPTAIGGISLDWADTNRVETFDTTFAYDYWEPFEGTTPSYAVVSSPD